jgi:hypothetical protein
MRIVAIGGSHTVGYGLHDVVDMPYDTVSQFAYPNVVADYFGCKVLNLGKCGNGIDQLYADVLDYLTYANPDDIVILQITTKIHWFNLITSDNTSIKIVNPDSLDFKGKHFKTALHQLMGTLTNDAHWQRTWFYHFFGLINLLQKSNTKFIWFFDRYFREYFEFEDTLAGFTAEVADPLRRICRATDALQTSYVGRVFTDFIDEYCPDNQTANGHYNELAHRFWAERLLIPRVKEWLTE